MAAAVVSRSAPNSPAGKKKKLQDQATTFLEQRRAAREARMEKVRQRIAHEKEQQQRAASQATTPHNKSTVERRQLAYDWYLRCGMVNRVQLKHCITKGSLTGVGLTASDVDLLPWNETGTLVPPSAMMKLSSS